MNLNRAREGLRVCEELARLVLSSAALTRRCQRLRYDLDRAAREIPGPELLKARDSRGDVGRPERRGPLRAHRQMKDLAQANAKRVQEALRVLEEFTRLEYPPASRRFGSLRFRAYSLEQDLLRRLPPLRHR
ncbi:MAG: hypothetical protein HYZ94_03735 [Candidatus Omnitrophica bacterium]|nr:hypothetical protein [Candidatus Omnitrophota bacterium]